MSKVIEFLKGKKTYIVAVGVGVVAALQYLGIEIPEWVWPIAGMLGLSALRAGANKK